MENTAETPVVEVLPIDDESNRLGKLIISGYERMIYEHTRHNGQVVFFTWQANERRGHRFTDLDEAANYLGISKPTGCADYNGEVKLGKCIEKFTNGEIWKHGDMFSIYYVWWNNSTSCNAVDTLAKARELANICTMSVHMSPPTLPKSAYPQNQKGYKAGGYTAKKSKANA